MLSLRSLLTFLSILLLCAPVIAWSRFDYVNGGHGWRQGDWLINFGDGLIRRGLIGEGLIFASDLSGVSLLLVTLLTQVIIFMAIAFVLWRIAMRYDASLVLLLLVASPAFFLIFFAANPMGSMRKEMFGVLAMALLTLSSLRRKQNIILPALAVAAYTVGCIGNILHLFMLPAVLTGLYLLRVQSVLNRQAFQALCALSTVMAIIWFGFSVWFNEISDLSAICGPLLTRGLDPEICNHAIRWLVEGGVSHMGQVSRRLTIISLAEYGAVLVLSLIPLALCFSVFAEKRAVWLILALCFLPLLPLYVTATDWGRWLSLSYTTAALLLVQAHVIGRITLIKQPSRYLTFALLGAALLIAPEHSIGWTLSGALPTIIETFRVFL